MATLHISFDLETLGSNPNSPIIQIGAQAFNESNDVFDWFSETVDISTIPKDKFEIDYSTILWWFDQIANNPNLIKNYHGDVIPHRGLIISFWKWLNKTTQNYDPKSVYYWSHSTFDPPILQNHFMQYDLGLIPYTQFLDLRTLSFLTNTKPEGRVGDHHNAYDDAAFQSEYIMKVLWNII